MPTIKASFFGPIIRPWPEQSRELKVPERSTIKQFLLGCGYTEDQMRRVAVVINGRRAGLDEIVRDGDDVRFVLLAGGG